jgi:hypothetical protein
LSSCQITAIVTMASIHVKTSNAITAISLGEFNHIATGP